MVNAMIDEAIEYGENIRVQLMNLRPELAMKILINQLGYLLHRDEVGCPDVGMKDQHESVERLVDIVKEQTSAVDELMLVAIARNSYGRRLMRKALEVNDE